MEIVKANIIDVEYLLDCELELLYFYKEMDDKERIKLIEYYRNEVINNIEYFKVILDSKEKIGCYLISKYLDGLMIDMMFIKRTYRNRGIGSKIIKDNLKNNTYLWVYKNNKKAFRFYNRFGFKIVNETNDRYYMKYTED